MGLARSSTCPARLKSPLSAASSARVWAFLWANAPAVEAMSPTFAQTTKSGVNDRDMPTPVFLGPGCSGCQVAPAGLFLAVMMSWRGVHQRTNNFYHLVLISFRPAGASTQRQRHRVRDWTDPR